MDNVSRFPIREAWRMRFAIDAAAYQLISETANVRKAVKRPQHREYRPFVSLLYRIHGRPYHMPAAFFPVRQLAGLPKM